MQKILIYRIRIWSRCVVNLSVSIHLKKCRPYRYFCVKVIDTISMKFYRYFASLCHCFDDTLAASHTEAISPVAISPSNKAIYHLWYIALLQYERSKEHVYTNIWPNNPLQGWFVPMCSRAHMVQKTKKWNFLKKKFFLSQYIHFIIVWTNVIYYNKINIQICQYRPRKIYE